MQTFSGILVDPLRHTCAGSRLFLAEDGTIDRIEPEAHPEQLYILPGLVDAHVHIESSMLTPAAFARTAAAHGTLAAVVDPHEIANVLGEDGFHLMLEEARQTPFVFGFGVPSCVPATPFETAGAHLDAAAVSRLLAQPGVTHLAEMMNVPGVLNHDPQIMAKLAAARTLGKPIDGHAPGLVGSALQAYVAAGIATDHESVTVEEAREKIQAGLKLLIRCGSASCQLEAFLPLLARYPDMCMFCSDDKHPDDLLNGHINRLAAVAIQRGIPIETVLRAACLNPVRHYRLPLGLLQPGDSADFMLVEDLRAFNPREVWLRGRLVARDGVPLLPVVAPRIANRFDAAMVQLEDLRVAAPEIPTARIIEVRDGQLVTGLLIEPAPTRDGWVVADPTRDIAKLVVCNRYAPTRPAVALVKGLGLTRGAIASSVAHDSHHIIAAGVSDAALAAAINEIALRKGGLAAADNNRKILTALPLPIAGLMSPEPAETVARLYADCDGLAKTFGSKLAAPFMMLSFLGLSVIPRLKLTDKGLFDGDAFQHVPLFVAHDHGAAI